MSDVLRDAMPAVVDSVLTVAFIWN